jgi:protein O-mannosyl-transferase
MAKGKYNSKRKKQYKKTASSRQVKNKKVVKQKPVESEEPPKEEAKPKYPAYKPVKSVYVFILFVVVSLLLYGNTVPFGYCLDDGIVVSKNNFVHRGLAGIPDIVSYDTMAGEHGKDVNFVAGGRYRPASVVTLAIEWEFFAYGIKLKRQGYEDIKNDGFMGPYYRYLGPVVEKDYEYFEDFESDLVASMGAERYKKYKSQILEYTTEAFGNPHVSHVINIILYAFVGFLIYLIFKKILTNPKLRPCIPKWFLSVPFLTALLFIAHPVHTEIVANIKGRDEIMALMGGLLSLWFVIRYIETRKIYNLLFVFVFFFTGLASKENAITFLAIIPFSLLFFYEKKIKFELKDFIGLMVFMFIPVIILLIVAATNTNDPDLQGLLTNLFIAMPILYILLYFIFNYLVRVNKRLKLLIISLLPALFASAVFLIIRNEIVSFISEGTSHELMNNPFVDASTSERYGTVFYTLLFYLRLLFFPHPLAWDYYPYYIPLVELTEPLSFIPFLIYVGLGIYAIWGLTQRNNVYAYGIWFYFAGISIVSNLLFSIGAFMSERFLFLPSVGFFIIVAYFFTRNLPEYLQNKKVLSVNHYKPVLTGVLLIILGLYSLKTVTRNRVWEGNFTLFTHDTKITTDLSKWEEDEITLKVAPEKSFSSAKGNTTAGEQYVIKAMSDESLDEETRERYYDEAVKCLHRAIEIHPRYIAARLDLGIAYEKGKKDIGKALHYYISTIKLKPDYEKAFNNINVIFNNLDSAELKLKVYEELYQINPNRYDVNYKLGSLYGTYKKDIKRAITFLERAVRIDPTQANAFTDLGVAYGMLGEYKQAAKMLEEAAKLHPDSPLIYRNLKATYSSMGNEEKAKYYERMAQEARQRLRLRSDRIKQLQQK